MNNQKGEVVLGIIGFIAIVGLFTAYVTGHPLPWGKAKTVPVSVVETIPAPTPEVTNG